MTVIGGEVVERHIAGLGTLRFENCAPGEWLTQKGEPAKKARRRYLLEQDELDSVSAIVGTLDKPALLNWYEDHGARGGARAQRLGELDDVPEEEIVQRVRALGFGANAVRDEAADRGKAVHAAFEALSRGQRPELSEHPALWRPWLTGAARAWLTLSPKAREIEQTVCHPDLGYAGRFDLVADIDGQRVLLDYKTGKGRVFEQAHYQTRLYAMAMEHSGLEPVDRIVIVGIDDQGGFELVDCEADEDDARALVAVFRSRKRVNAGMAAQRKATKKAAKEAA